MLKAREKQGMCGPGETGRRGDDRTDRGERGLERGEPSSPSSGYLRALDSSATEDSLLWKFPNTTKHRSPTSSSCIPPRFWWPRGPGSALSMTQTSPPSCAAPWYVLPTRCRPRQTPVLLETAFGPVLRRIHARSDLMTDLQPFRACVGSGWCAGAYDCLYVTRLLARRHRFSPHWRFSAPRGCHIKRSTCLLTSPLHHAGSFGAPDKLDVAPPIRRRAAGNPRGSKTDTPDETPCVLQQVPSVVCRVARARPHDHHVDETGIHFGWWQRVAVRLDAPMIPPGSTALGYWITDISGCGAYG